MNKLNLIKASFSNMLKVMPELRHATIDPRTGQILFKGSPLGARFERFVEGLREADESIYLRDSDPRRSLEQRESQAGKTADGMGQPHALRNARSLYGSASIKRFLLANTAAQYPSGEGRRLVLDRLGNRLDDLVALDGRDHALYLGGRGADLANCVTSTVQRKLLVG